MIPLKTEFNKVCLFRTAKDIDWHDDWTGNVLPHDGFSAKDPESADLPGLCIWKSLLDRGSSLPVALHCRIVSNKSEKSGSRYLFNSVKVRKDQSQSNKK